MAVQKWRFPDNNYTSENGLDTSDMEMFKKDPVSSLAREICQNSIDAAYGAKPVRVEFSLFQVARDEVPGIDDLTAQVNACYEYKKSSPKEGPALKELKKSISKDIRDILRASSGDATDLEGAGEFLSAQDDLGGIGGKAITNDQVIVKPITAVKTQTPKTAKAGEAGETYEFGQGELTNSGEPGKQPGKLIENPNDSKWLQSFFNGTLWTTKKYEIEEFTLRIPKDDKDRETDLYNSIMPEGSNISLRDAFKLEINFYLLYLASGDGKITAAERDYINDLLDLDVSTQGFVQLINEHNIYSTDFEDRSPITLQLVAAFDKKMKQLNTGVAPLTPALIEFMERIGKEFINCDNNVHNQEVADYTLYISKLKSKFLTSISNSDEVGFIGKKKGQSSGLNTIPTKQTSSNSHRYGPSKYKVGVDIPAGEYKLFCSDRRAYYCISSDANAQRIIRIGLKRKWATAVLYHPWPFLL